jgi:carboxypeptidase family protein
MARIRAGLLELKAVCVGNAAPDSRQCAGGARQANNLNLHSAIRALQLHSHFPNLQSAICTVNVLSLLTVVPAARASAQGVGVVQIPGASTQAPPRDNVPKTGTAILRGRVVAADSGLPLRKAMVRIFAAELRENRMTTTDPQGRYEFRDLPAGRYTVMASKGGFVGLTYGQTKPLGGGKLLTIRDAETAEKVDFSLWHGSVITGRILDEFGEPISDVQVTVQQYRYLQGRRRLMQAGRSVTTNDIGEFRIYGLAPGQYYLSAFFRNLQQGNSDDRSGYVPTYYPGTANPQTAEKIVLAAGQTVNDVTMTLTPAQTAHVSGTAVDSQGHPLTFVSIVQQLDRISMGANGAGVKPDGTFSFSGVAPGDYTLQARSDDDAGEVAVADVTVNGDDVTDVRLVGTPPVTLSGRIVVDAAAAAAFHASMYRVNVMPVHEEMTMGGIPAAKLNDDLTFSVHVHPGLMRVVLGSTAPGTIGTIFVQRAIRWNGVDITDAGIEIKPGQDVEGLQIELTTQISKLSGIVTDAHGEAVKDYVVVIFPQDREKWTAAASRYMKSGHPDQDGRFKIQGLPPGDYDAVALDYVEPGESSDPEFLERIRSKATPFSVNEGETKTLDLKLSSSSS